MPHASKFRRAARFKTRARPFASRPRSRRVPFVAVRLARRRPRPDSRQPTGARHPVRRFASRPRASRSVPPSPRRHHHALGCFALAVSRNVRAVSAERPGPDAQRLLHLQHETRTADGFPDVPRPSKHLRHRAFEKAPALPRVESIGVHGLRVVAFCARQRRATRARGERRRFSRGRRPSQRLAQKRAHSRDARARPGDGRDRAQEFSRGVARARALRVFRLWRRTPPILRRLRRLRAPRVLLFLPGRGRRRGRSRRDEPRGRQIFGFGLEEKIPSARVAFRVAERYLFTCTWT